MPVDPMPSDSDGASAVVADVEDDASRDDGVDRTLIRWYLQLTPAERLRRLQGHARAIWRLRRDNPNLRA